MNLRFPLLAFSLQLFLLAPLSAQTPSAGGTPVECPKGPLVAAAIPDRTTWKIASISHSSADAAALKTAAGAPAVDTGSVSTLFGERAGKIGHFMTTQGANQIISESWRSGENEMVRLKQAASPTVVPAGTYAMKGDFGWISPSTFKGIKKVNGIDCMIFSTSRPDVQGGADACIELERRLPVSVKTVQKFQNDVYITTETSYEFNPIPTGRVLTLPPEFEKPLLDQQQKAKQEALRPPPI